MATVRQSVFNPWYSVWKKVLDDRAPTTEHLDIQVVKEAHKVPFVHTSSFRFMRDWR